jgi:hypothetical protein
MCRLDVGATNPVFLMESALTSHGSSKSIKKPSDGRGISNNRIYIVLLSGSWCKHNCPCLNKGMCSCVKPNTTGEHIRCSCPTGKGNFMIADILLQLTKIVYMLNNKIPLTCRTGASNMFAGGVRFNTTAHPFI